MKRRSSACESRLAEFAEQVGVKSKGPLSTMLVVTRRARDFKPPFRESDFTTTGGGQVAGAGKGAVQKILSEHAIPRVLAKEGGRTSRGSLKRMTEYLGVLNELAEDGLLDFDLIEEFWIQRVREFFAHEPLKIKIDSSKSMRRIVADLMSAAQQRQSECSGTMVVGAVMQHLVGAKLELALPETPIEHQGFSVADEQTKRHGDFLVNDTAIHVTTAPTGALMQKCASNIDAGLRPLIITTDKGVGGAEASALDSGLEDRVDVLDIEQFVATNVYEWIRFANSERLASVRDLIVKYNDIVEDCETDPSLRIVIG